MRIGNVQFKIMRVLWKLGEANARQISDELAGDSTMAHSTVQTLLRQLESKGAIAHTKVDRTFIFRPLIKESEVSRSAAQELLSKVFGGSVSGLVAHLLDSEEISEEELKQLRAVVEEKTQEGRK